MSVNLFYNRILIWVVLLLSSTTVCGSSVPSAYINIARETGVPRKILYAVAVVESRRMFNGLRRPWPWTLNVSGKPYYFESRKAAAEMLETEVSNGNMNIAIGIMQIYWRYHHENFDRPSDLLDAETNLRYGAKYLRKMFDIEGDWYQAVGQYHSGNKTPEGIKRANIYAENVVREWKNI